MRRVNIKLFVLFAVISSAIYFYGLFQPQQIKAIIGDSAGSADKIYMFNGRTGQNYTSVDKQKINEFLLILDKPKFQLKPDQWDIRMGFSYYIDLYQNGKKLARVQFQGSRAIINGLIYDLDRDVSKEADDFWQSLAKGN